MSTEREKSMHVPKFGLILIKNEPNIHVHPLFDLHLKTHKGNTIQHFINILRCTYVESDNFPFARRR